VPAFGPNGTWYSHHVYMDPNSQERIHHETTYGPLEMFGYKDFILMFTGEQFDADEWAELSRKAGARFAGPVAWHHEGFSLWDTNYSPWNAARMGPKRDAVGELSKAIKTHDMKLVVALHHMKNWYFFSTWNKRYDCGEPRYSGLYATCTESSMLFLVRCGRARSARCCHASTRVPSGRAFWAA